MKTQFGYFEAGISTVAEMVNLEQIIKPTIGVLTSIDRLMMKALVV
jgi:alanine racemase